MQRNYNLAELLEKKSARQPRERGLRCPNRRQRNGVAPHLAAALVAWHSGRGGLGLHTTAVGPHLSTPLWPAVEATSKARTARGSRREVRREARTTHHCHAPTPSTVCQWCDEQNAPSMSTYMQGDPVAAVALHHHSANRILPGPMPVVSAQMWKRDQQLTKAKDEDDKMKSRGNGENHSKG